MTPVEAKEYLKDKDFLSPRDVKVGDFVEGLEIIDIKGLVDGKPTYASTFVCKANINPKDWRFCYGRSQ